MVKNVVISGASSGIGLATANYFSEKGYEVWCLARKKPENYPYHFVCCDVSSEQSIVDAVAEILKQVDRIDAVVCNAGIGLGGALETSKIDDVKKMFDVNVFGAHLLAKAFIPKMKEQKFGKIVFISSVGSIFALPFQGVYSATKCALESLAYAYRAELHPFNIQVGCILPGDTKTNFTQARKNDYTLREYGGRDKKSIEKMEKDERNGMSPRLVAKAIYKQVNKKNMAPRKIVGGKYKVFAFLQRLFPQRFILWIVRKMYAD